MNQMRRLATSQLTCLQEVVGPWRMFIDEEGSNAYALRWVSSGVIFIPTCIETPNPGNESVA